MVSYRIAQKDEAHTIAETLIKPCVIDIVTCMLDDKFAKHLSMIALSNNTVILTKFNGRYRDYHLT